jgi:hypothetical protein
LFGFIGFMMFSAAFNNISVMAASFIGGGNQRKAPTCRKLLTSFIT